MQSLIAPQSVTLLARGRVRMIPRKAIMITILRKKQYIYLHYTLQHFIPSPEFVYCMILVETRLKSWKWIYMGKSLLHIILCLVLCIADLYLSRNHYKKLATGKSGNRFNKVCHMLLARNCFQKVSIAQKLKQRDEIIRCALLGIATRNIIWWLAT